MGEAARVIFTILYAFLGGLNVASAISEYKKDKYLSGSFNGIIALWCIFMIAKMVFAEEL